MRELPIAFRTRHSLASPACEYHAKSHTARAGKYWREPRNASESRTACSSAITRFQTRLQMRWGRQPGFIRGVVSSRRLREVQSRRYGIPKRPSPANVS